MNRAKPEGKISEVVDDMLDAVAGADPLVFSPAYLIFIILYRNFVKIAT